MTFIAPIADSLQYVIPSTGSTLNFGIVVIAGMLVGSFLTSLLTRSFHVEGCSSANHMFRSVRLSKLQIGSTAPVTRKGVCQRKTRNAPR